MLNNYEMWIHLYVPKKKELSNMETHQLFFDEEG